MRMQRLMTRRGLLLLLLLLRITSPCHTLLWGRR